MNDFIFILKIIGDNKREEGLKLIRNRIRWWSLFYLSKTIGEFHQIFLEKTWTHMLNKKITVKLGELSHFRENS